jgi:hypothetical protein
MSAEAQSDQRRDRRLAPDRQDTIKICLPWYGGQRRETLCVLVDASASGAGILLTERLARGTRLTLDGDVEINSVRYRIAGTAEVMNSRMEDRGLYRIGLHFVDVIWERVESEARAQPAVVVAAEPQPERGPAS